nr:hypothetical protein GCM10020093_042780 [Planobispora longispora]
MMNDFTRWIDLEGAVNVRDLGGLATVDGGTTRFGRVYRSDNLQGLTGRDVERLVDELKLRHVVDLRSGPEVSLEGPGPLTRVPEVTIHHHTFFAEGGRYTDVDADTGGADGTIGGIDADKVLPWQRRAEADAAELRVTGFYYGYLRDRPDSVVAALRAMSADDGAAVVHCAAGKDRTGVVCALALEIAGATRRPSSTTTSPPASASRASWPGCAPAPPTARISTPAPPTSTARGASTSSSSCGCWTSASAAPWSGSRPRAGPPPTPGR